ncbi:MAG: TonB-dependent receptor [Chitinophagaceae bacterium]|nr:TonB-dependent receptor [Chitinophagaceae bacterium]
MNTKTNLLTAFLLTLTIGSFAQTNGKISGNIIDGGDQKIIDAATISLLKAKDSSLVKLSLTDKEGHFSFENVKIGNYLIMASSIGHRKVYSSPVSVIEGANLSVGTLQLVTQTTTLQTVAVDTKKPFIERQIDKTIVNVDALISNAGSTALEVLEKSPGVSVDKDGNISLKGKQGVIIMMDGKPAYLSGAQLTNLLKSMPSSAIEQIEIMTNPSAKYDASGNSGIINLRTRKNKMIGFNGSNSTNYSQGVLPRFSNSINLNYRKGKINLFGNYNYSYRSSFEKLSLNRNFINSTTKEIETIFEQSSYMKSEGQGHNAKAGMDFYATDKTTFGIVLSGYINSRTNTGENTTYLKDKNNVVDYILNATNNEKNKYSNFGTNFNLRHIFDSTKKEITADLDYRTYTQSTNQFFTNNYLNADFTKRKNSTELRGNLPSDVKIYSAKVDYTMPLKKGAKLEAGLKTSYVNTDNDARYDSNTVNGWVVDNGKTNHFIYKENINSGYINFNRQINKKWGVQAGLRVENTIATGHQFGTPGSLINVDSSFKLNYTNLFPTVYLSYQANKNNNFNLNFGRRIDRPSYQDLNPFYYFLDEFTYKKGNTLLKPQFTNSVEFSHTYKNFLTTTLNYSRTEDAFIDALDQITTERKTFLSTKNIGTKQNMGIAVSANFPVNKIWSTNIYANVFTNKYYGVLNTGILDVSATAFMTNINNQFKFKKGWSAELSGFYRSKGLEGQLVANAMWQVTSGVQKQVLKNKGTVRFFVSDIFNSQNFSGSVKYQDIDVHIRNSGDRRRASLTFTYRFGKPIQNQPRKKSGGLDEESRVKG